MGENRKNDENKEAFLCYHISLGSGVQVRLYTGILLGKGETRCKDRVYRW